MIDLAFISDDGSRVYAEFFGNLPSKGEHVVFSTPDDDDAVSYEVVDIIHYYYPNHSNERFHLAEVYVK